MGRVFVEVIDEGAGRQGGVGLVDIERIVAASFRAEAVAGSLAEAPLDAVFRLGRMLETKSRRPCKKQGCLKISEFMVTASCDRVKPQRVNFRTKDDMFRMLKCFGISSFVNSFELTIVKALPSGIQDKYTKLSSSNRSMRSLAKLLVSFSTTPARSWGFTLPAGETVGIEEKEEDGGVLGLLQVGVMAVFACFVSFVL